MGSRPVLALMLAVLPSVALLAQTRFDWHTSTQINAGSGTFAPYYIASNADGIVTQGRTFLERAGIGVAPVEGHRFAWGAGFEGVADIASPAGYERWNFDENRLGMESRRPALAWIQQLWGEVRWRSLFLTAGMKSNDRSLFDSSLGLGDIVLSRNARPVPQVRLGFRDFVAVPLTKDRLWIRGELAYGKFTDGGWLEDHYNYADHFLTTGVWFHYKSLYFSSRPDGSFRIVFGMQHAAQFGGNQQYWRDGVMTLADGGGVSFKDFLDIFVPLRNGSGHTAGDQAYYNGNHLGSWDIQLSYRNSAAGDFQLYAQLPWEDGSGIGKLNGWDGVWGARWEPVSGPVEGVEIAYLDFMNQSGPMHWAPGDHPGVTIPGQATGSDDYYNNYFYDGWANYGMALGTPFLKAPIYNRNGYLRFSDTRMRGFQIGAKGSSGQVGWRGLVSWRRSWGTPYIPRTERKKTVSVMAEAIWRAPRVKGLSLKGQIAFDSGSLYQAGVGLMVSAEYRGSFSSRKR